MEQEGKQEMYDIPGFYGYKVDKFGNIYSYLGVGCRNRFDTSKWLKIPKKLKPRPTKTGYLRVYMRDDKTNKRVDAYVHRIVASVFIPNPLNLSDVNHKDSNPTNNRMENLEWMSHKENLEYGFKYGNKNREKNGTFSKK